MASKPPVHSEQYPPHTMLILLKNLRAPTARRQYPSADVCIVGGGFGGINTAIELAQRGMSVVLLKPNELAGAHRAETAANSFVA